MDLTVKEKNENIVVEYGNADLWTGIGGKKMLEVMDKLINSRRKALEDYEKGDLKYEIVRTIKKRKKCSKGRYLCKIQLRQSAGGKHRSTDKSDS